MLLADSVDDTSARERWRRASCASTGRAAVEQSFNLIEVPYLFAERNNTLEDDEDEVPAATHRRLVASVASSETSGTPVSR